MMIRLLIAAILVLPAHAETLRYALMFQSGLKLGEAALIADSGEAGWSFRASADASIPGFALRDEYKSATDAKFCSQTLERNLQRGSRKNAEKVTFDQEHEKVLRQTVNGGKSEISAEPCAHDAMAFLKVLRQELAKGHMVSQQAVYLGAKYDLKMTLLGTESIRRGEKRVDADHVQAKIRGPKADYTIEVYFARDAARTPILARLPLALGTFTLELLP
jgi:hypothetical protein